MADVKINVNPTPTKTEETSSPVEKVNTFARTDNQEIDMKAPYTDVRQVTISPTRNYSAYRKVNMKAMGQRTEVIGSSVSSTRILSSNAEEVAAYFPQLIGLSPNNPDFVRRVKEYLSNIQFIVNEEGSTLDTSFAYNHYEDYLNIKRQEDEIEAKYDKVNRANLLAKLEELKKALKTKIDELSALESTKFRFGQPVNLDQYIVYRHCLLYKDVAKDIAIINEDASLRFYIKDEAREAAKQKKLVDEKKKAMRAFVELCASENKFNAVYMQIAIRRNDILSEAITKTMDEKENIVMNYVNEAPDKFNKLVNDKNVVMKGFIETLIMRGELIRAEYNQQISTADGQFIGSNVNEAVAYFNNPNNKAVYEAYQNKLKHS